MVFRASRYPSDWRAISKRIRESRAGNRCECAGECGDQHEGENGRCDAPNGVRICRELNTPAKWLLEEHVGSLVPFEAFTDPVKVVLTVAHLDHDERNNVDSNLCAMCQRCHLRLDATDNARRRREGIARAAGQGTLFDGGAR